MSSCFLTPTGAMRPSPRCPLVQLTEGEILSVLSVTVFLPLILPNSLSKEYEAYVV